MYRHCSTSTVPGDSVGVTVVCASVFVVPNSAPTLTVLRRIVLAASALVFVVANVAPAPPTEPSSTVQ